MTQTPSTPSAEPKATKKRRRDAYCAVLKVAVPIDASDPKSYEDAVIRVKAMADDLPIGSTCTVAGSLGKLPGA